MLTQVMNNLLLGLRLVLESFVTTFKQVLFFKKQYPLLKTTQNTQKKEPLNEIPSLKYPVMFQTSNLTEN